MKKVFNWICLVLYCILPIYFLVILLVSAFGGYKIEELIDTNWWMFFFVFEIWFTSVSRIRLDEAFDNLKNK